MMHQARPTPVHLAGQEGVRFSINQILSPASEESNMEEESYPYPGRYYGTKQGAYPEKSANEQMNGYFYPKLENYFGEKWVGSHYSSGAGRFPDSSIYYQGFNDRNSSCYQQESLGSNTKEGSVFQESKTLPGRECEFTSHPAGVSPNQDVTSQSMTSPDRQYSGYNNCRYPRSGNGDFPSPDHAALRPEQNSLKNAESEFSGRFSGSKYYGNCWDNCAAAILARGGSSSSCEGRPFSSISSPTSSQSFSSTGAGNLLGVLPPSTLRSPLLPSNFPWMESRRERIAREFIVTLFLFCIHKS